jgi:MFS family permease
VPRISPDQARRALRLSVVEAATWATMVGLAETYFIATAVHLGAGALGVGLAVALPLALGSSGPVVALAFLSRLRGRRPFAVGAVFLQATTLLAVAARLAAGHLSVVELIAGLCLYQITGQAAGTAWASWYGDLVPSETRGRWFSRRNRVVYLATCAGLVAGGMLLQWIEPEGVHGARSQFGLALLIGLAALARIGSGILLALSPEPPFRGIPTGGHVARFSRTQRGRQAVRVLLIGSLFHFAVYSGAPYFAPFMLETLGFDYLQYMIAALCAIVAKALFTAGWGHLTDRQSARLVYLGTMLGVALVPLPWFWANGLLLVLFAQVFSGSMWSGYEVGYLTMLLENSTAKTRPWIFASQSVVNGTMQIAGTLFAAQLVLPLVGDYRGMFLVSSGLRTAVFIAAPFALASLIPGQRLRWSEVGVRFFGLRPHGGFSVRPILPSEGEEAPGQE